MMIPILLWSWSCVKLPFASFISPGYPQLPPSAGPLGLLLRYASGIPMFSTHGPTRPKPVQPWAFVVLVLVLVVDDEPRVLPYHNQRAPLHSGRSLDRLMSKS